MEGDKRQGREDMKGLFCDQSTFIICMFGNVIMKVITVYNEYTLRNGTN
jgi:hypothetical protein